MFDAFCKQSVLPECIIIFQKVFLIVGLGLDEQACDCQHRAALR